MRRNLGDARRAYGLAGQSEDAARQLSQAAHSVMSSEPKGALASAGWTEGGHNEETTHLGAKLMLRGGVEGLMASLSVLALAHGAGWPPAFSVPVSLVLTGCWAVCAACREGLDSVTYSAHYARERSREAWGEACTAPPRPPHPPAHPTTEPRAAPRARSAPAPSPDATRVRLAPPLASPTPPRFPPAHSSPRLSPPPLTPPSPHHPTPPPNPHPTLHAPPPPPRRRAGQLPRGRGG